MTKYPAWSLYAAIVSLYLFSLWALMAHRAEETYWSWQETLHILHYSTLQAALSATLSLIFGVLAARSFFYLRFSGKAFLYKLFSFSWALPSLVVIFAIIGVWGTAGWMAQFFRCIGLEWQFKLYGLQGILLAHLFFNIPLVMKYCVEGLRLIPSHQHQLAAQLNLRGWRYFQIVELPTLKGILPYAYTNVFLVCFTSFPIVLMLGGGPKYSTLEVAIYQAVTFEFDFAKAVILILTQVFAGIVLQILMDWVTKNAFHKTAQAAAVDAIWTPKPQGGYKWWLVLILGLMVLMIALPLLNVIYSALSVSDFLRRLLLPQLWQATLYSFLLSVIAALSVITIALLLALETRRLAYHGHKIRHSILAGVTTYPLILPIFLLAIGLFLLLMENDLGTLELLLLVGICNGLTLLPYIYRLIYAAMWKALISHDKLAQSLGLSGWKRWWIVERSYLIRPLRNAFALAMSASLGSFAVIAFFGSPDFSTLPYLLYQQLGSYRNEDAAITALVLMLFALLPFLLIEQQERYYD